MSFKGKNGETEISFNWLWTTIAKIAFALAIPTFFLGVSWAVWITTTTFSHGQELAVMKEIITQIKSKQHGLATQAGINTKKVLTAVQSQNQEAN